MNLTNANQFYDDLDPQIQPSQKLSKEEMQIFKLLLSGNIDERGVGQPSSSSQ